jgi:hypothetical protein
MRVAEVAAADVDLYDGVRVYEELVPLSLDDLEQFSPIDVVACPWFDPESADANCGFSTPAIRAGLDSLPFIIGAPAEFRIGQLFGVLEVPGESAVFWDFVGIAALNAAVEELGALERCRTGCLQTYRCSVGAHRIEQFYRVFDFIRDPQTNKISLRVLSERIDLSYEHIQESP